MFKFILTFSLTIFELFVYSKSEFYKSPNKCENCILPPLFLQNNGIYGHPCLPQAYQTQNPLLNYLVPMRQIDSDTNCINCIIPQKFSSNIAGRRQKQDYEVNIKKGLFFF